MPGMCTYVDGLHAKEVLAESRTVSTTPFGCLLPSDAGGRVTGGESRRGCSCRPSLRPPFRPKRAFERSRMHIAFTRIHFPRFTLTVQSSEKKVKL